ncbi:MAG: peptide-binding protein [Candidatus Krumholzibacteriia bacterium]
MRLPPSIQTAIFALCLALPACGGGDEQATPGTAGTTTEAATPGGTVIRHLQADCKTLNWVLYTTVYEDYVLRCLYDNLLDYDAKMEIQPVLAKSVKVSDDHLRITVELRDSLFWHDGEPITSEDVAFTVDKIRDPAVPAVNKEGWFNKLDKVEVVDDKTIVFVWSVPYAPALHALTKLSPIPKHIYGKGDFLTNPANRAPVGSGAFRFEEWQTSRMISVVRNDNYYRRKAYLDRIIFRVIPDRSVALNAMKTGQLDEMRLRQQQWEQVSGDKAFVDKFNMNYYDVPQYNYLSWNCRAIWFKDKRVRRALTMLFDREEIIATLYSGFSKPVSGPFYINSPAYDHSVAPYPYDPQAAVRLLEDAGWIDNNGDGVREKDDVNFEFEFYVTSGSRIGQSFAQLLQEQCEKAGIIVKIRRLESATFFDKVFKGEYDAAALAWQLDIDPDLYDTFHSTQVPPIGLNHAFYNNPEVDTLLERARVEFDKDKRNELYHQVHRLIHEDSPYTFVNSVPEKRPVHHRIGNVAISPSGPFRFYPGGIYWYVKSDMMEARK